MKESVLRIEGKAPSSVWKNEEKTVSAGCFLGPLFLETEGRLEPKEKYCVIVANANKTELKGGG